MDDNDTQKEPSNEGATTPPNTEQSPASSAPEQPSAEGSGTTSPPFAPPTEPFRELPENDGEVPSDNREAPKTSQDFPTSTHEDSEKTPRTADHILSVAEVALHFLQNEVPRTRRTITSWCTANTKGESKLDCFFDDTQHRYYITQVSVDQMLKSERSKEELRQRMRSAQPFLGNTPRPHVVSTEATKHDTENVPPQQELTEKVTALEREVRSLAIANDAKDKVIEHLSLHGEKVTAHFAEQMTAQARALSASLQRGCKTARQT